jgi:hypothetical protein
MDDIQKLHDELKKLPREDLEGQFMRTLIAYHSKKWWPTGFFNVVGENLPKLEQRLGTLSENLMKQSESQGRLAIALNWITAMLVVVGLLQVTIGALQVYCR